jgi:ketosteroid isomerase-like protein
MSEQRIHDELDIRTLLAELAFQADDGELDTYIDLFTDDAVWEMPANAAAGVPASRCEGHAEISASVQQRRAIGVQGPGTGAMHHLTTVRIDVQGDEASGYVYYQFVGMAEGRPAVRTVGRYRDTYRRTAAGWKLSHRTVVIS